MNVDTTYSPPVADIDRARSRALMVGVIGLVGCGIGLLVDRDHFFRAWLVAYIRALQLSMNATVADVPADRRSDLDRPAQENQ